MQATERFGAPHALVLLFMVMVAGYFLLPLYWLFVSATKSTGDLFSSNGLAFADWNLWDNVGQVLRRDGGVFGRWMLNSLLYAVVGGIGNTLLAAMVGYALAKYQFAGRSVVFWIVIGAVLVPGPALTLPLYLLLSQVGMVNSYWAVLLPLLVNPFGVYLARVYTASAVPDELLDAARMDGGGELRIFTTMVLPILSPVLVTMFLFSSVGIWNNYFLPLVMLNDVDLFPVTLGLVLWNQNASLGQGPPLYNLILCGAFLSIIPLTVSFLLLQRFWRNGLLLGSNLT